jgi:transcription-repair coupling factor (superfamily II helicase)
MLDDKFLEKTSQIKIADVGPNIQPYLLREILSKITGRDIIFIAKDRTEGQKIINTLQFLIGQEVLFLPEWDTAPYENISPAQGLLHQRMRALFQIINTPGQKIIVTTTRAALQRLPAKSILKSKNLALQLGGVISRDTLIKCLTELGYSRVSCVITPGEFAIRGGIVDISAGEVGYGYRIDFFGDRVESIKIFDTASQLTSESRTLINIFPPSELIISPDTISNFDNYLLSIVGAGYKENQMFASLQDQIKPVGIENFLPAFYSKLNDIFEYLKDPVIILDNFIKLEADKFLDKAQGIYANKADEYKKTKCELLAPDKIWLSKKDLKDTLETSCVIEFSPFKDTSGNYIKAEIEAIPAFHERSGSFELLKNFIDEQISLSRQVIVSCLSEGSRERIIKILNDHEIETIKGIGWPDKNITRQTYVIVSPIEYGAAYLNYAIITEEDLFGEKIKAVKTKKKISGGSLEQSFQIDDLVVHKEYGVGRFEGLVLVKLSNSQHDCLKILYSGNDRLFVPVENMDVIVRYGSSNENIALDSLERTSWQLKKAKAKNRIREIAVYLLEIAARRNLEQADKITFAEGAYDEFCSGFPYVETEDQEATIAAVLEDLASGKPMDRLICGDTGVGKTEVAIRAAFVVAQSQSQALEKKLVTLICPTTLLCRQHYKVFKARFKNLNVNIVQLSRLVSPAEKQKVIQEINSGKVNIVIGTHALLTDKIDYKNLALLIVDEEHHFGVSHKEKLKRLKENIHVLTLSATPIPRTLQMSLAGIRELNLISTPPISRIATKISVSSFDPVMIKEALVREKTRGGQSFYICPRISDLSHVEETLKALLPGFKLVKAHGKLPVSELDKIMEEFYEGKFDILLSTSIIESGLDVPKANTIIIHNSDRFGLAQLYQIKGRVGRSNLDSYAYFTVQDNKLLTQETLKKLQVLQNLDELGAGFAVSSYDMDIRGFGNLLGEEQSGHIKEIGVELYQQMLEETLAELKRKDSQTPIKESWTPQINIDLPILIPEAYIPEFNLRLSLYKRASSLTNETELTAFAAELIDRFGPIPIELESLLSVIRLKQLCLEAFVTKINLGDKGILIEFVENKDPKLAEKLFEFVMKNKDKVKIKTSNSIVLIAEIKEPIKRLQLAKKFLETIVVP